MSLSEQQIRELKQQLKSQLGHLPSERRVEAEAQIDLMSSDAIEEMLQQQQSRQEIYRMVVSGELPATVVKENADALAVMEIRPLSKGHVLVIPKERVREIKLLPKKIIEFAKELGDTVKDRLEANEIIIRNVFKFGEAIIEIIPKYDNEIDENVARENAPKEELESVAREIQKEVVKIEKKAEVIEENKEKEIPEERKVILRRRIP